MGVDHRGGEEVVEVEDNPPSLEVVVEVEVGHHALVAEVEVEVEEGLLQEQQVPM